MDRTSIVMNRLGISRKDAENILGAIRGNKYWSALHGYNLVFVLALTRARWRRNGLRIARATGFGLIAASDDLGRFISRYKIVLVDPSVNPPLAVAVLTWSAFTAYMRMDDDEKKIAIQEVSGKFLTLRGLLKIVGE